MRRAIAVSILCTFFGSVAQAACDVPGSRNLGVTQDNIDLTICKRGWTRTIRPPQSYTARLKRQLLPRGAHVSEFELDHCLPLELGGHPTDHANLWLQPWGGRCGALAKDQTEDFLRSLVCSRLITLAEAQDRVMNWCKESP